jgi:hypothetical protein
MSQFDWPITKKRLYEAPQNGRFYGKMECLPLWPTYIGEKGRTLGKTCGIKVRCYWEHPWGTHWEHIGNQGKMKKKSFPPETSKEKKAQHLECLLGSSHWLHEICLPKRVHHHFWHGLLPLAKNTLPIELKKC